MSSTAPASSPHGEAARLLVVRHGQSTWNAEGRWQGTENPPLSPLGVHQARRAAALVGAFDLIASSTLDRAHTTASLIADALGVGPVVADPQLVERHAGVFQGLTKPEIRERFPGYLESGREPEGWEDDDAVAARATEALARLAHAVGAGGTALVVTHGGVIKVLERLLDVRRDERLANLGGRWFEIGPGHLRAGDTVVLADPEDVTVPGQL